ncbi:MarR family winged helix-turn-helix transcriptional regulator [Breznakiella homolactica]|uniref:MarR family transcriptional regulator n=1 Tax=Breznakiella homolactica TaxID=2798577 RepID=A0A7T7XK01_9SPIR|nr:MarR family transcriptional regulator [Breznakiella homolactica]QQO07771.1 MarR family transcriptional regulator [Breznakiella homolactica]
MNAAQDIFFTHQALAALFSVTNKLQMRGDKYLQDLTIRQMLAVPAIIHAPDGKATISHIARQLGTTKQSAKQIVDALERKNYLSVTPSELDKRAVNITITPEGARAFSLCAERTDEFLADIFHDFTTEDLKALWTMLQKLYRFDGIAQEGFDEPKNNHPGDADDMLRHHQNFIKRRSKNHAKNHH